MKDIGAGSRQREQYLCLSSYSGGWGMDVGCAVGSRGWGVGKGAGISLSRSLLAKLKVLHFVL